MAQPHVPLEVKAAGSAEAADRERLTAPEPDSSVMRWWLIGLVALGFLVEAWRRRVNPEQMSADWLAGVRRKEDRVEFHGVGWIWPLNKLALENGWKNRYVLRQDAERKRA